MRAIDSGRSLPSPSFVVALTCKQLEIRRLHRELGVTMVFVTHDQTEAMTLSDRVAVFNHGRIEQLASPQQLYDTPSNPFVAGFVGDNNMLGGRAEGPESSAQAYGTSPPHEWNWPVRCRLRRHLLRRAQSSRPLVQ